MTQGQALARTLNDIAEALHAKNQGRYTECWPLVSFRGKDADVDAAGCTGITALAGVRETLNGSTLRVLVGGHKRFCDPTDACEQELAAKKRDAWHRTFYQSLCALLSQVGATLYDWDGDCWMASWEACIEVPLHALEACPETVAERILQAAHNALLPFEHAMHAADAMLDNLRKEIDGQTPDDAGDSL